ncbi:CXXC-type zinc finger protein 1-like [Brienomyrus brachyistius]|uniref:CXXC-type zinc finger protein 1-like n=1 Tax=Brienomyrus brachyistius TaxID=42636 RepID=UPI0020B3F010|nr:CXXC-type zinc finger protein 1-like [Brienomyrus brachyistius]
MLIFGTLLEFRTPGNVKYFSMYPGMDNELSDFDQGLGAENGENAPVYCVCHKPDINCFMIDCGNCNEWFHGNCINVTEKMGKTIQEWYCEKCRSRDGSLEIKYHPKENHKETDQEKMEKQHVTPNFKINWRMKRHMCGKCEPCRRTEDCAQCDFCKDMRRFGGPNKIRQKCRLRQCVVRAKKVLRVRAVDRLATGNAFDAMDQEKVPPSPTLSPCAKSRAIAAEWHHGTLDGTVLDQGSEDVISPDDPETGVGCQTDLTLFDLGVMETCISFLTCGLDSVEDTNQRYGGNQIPCKSPYSRRESLQDCLEEIFNLAC